MKHPIISLFLNNKNWAKQEMNDERNKLLTFIAIEWTGNQRVFTNYGRNGQELPPPEPRTARTLSWMARAGEEERGYRPGLFCPGWSYQPWPNPLHLSRLVAPSGTIGPRGSLFLSSFISYLAQFLLFRNREIMGGFIVKVSSFLYHLNSNVCGTFSCAYIDRFTCFSLSRWV